MLKLPGPARTYTVQNPIFILACYATLQLYIRFIILTF